MRLSVAHSGPPSANSRRVAWISARAAGACARRVPGCRVRVGGSVPCRRLRASVQGARYGPVSSFLDEQKGRGLMAAIGETQNLIDDQPEGERADRNVRDLVG